MPQDSDEMEIRRLTDELFLSTDEKDWPAVRALFVEGPMSFRRERERWRIASFRYDSKMTRGSDSVRTHSAP